jgi:hypothetical protein
VSYVNAAIVNRFLPTSFLRTASHIVMFSRACLIDTVELIGVGLGGNRCIKGLPYHRLIEKLTEEILDGEGRSKLY